MIISFIGNDGCGKTTLLKEVAKELSNSKNVIIIDEFDYFLLGPVKRIFAKSTRALQASFQDKDNGKLVKKLMPYFIWLDLIAEYFYRSLFQKSKIVLKDRHAYDFLITWREQKITNELIEFLYNEFPVSGLLFYISTEPGVAYQRRVLQKEKQEKEYMFYVEKTNMYEIFFKTHSILTIDNNKDKETAKNKLLHYIDLREKLLKTKEIAISGLDGSGKSTTVNNLTMLLKQLNVPHRTIHFYYNYTILKIVKLLKKKIISNNETIFKKSIEHEKQSLQKRKGKFWVLLVMSDAFLQYILVKIFYFRKLIIFDRYFQDYYVSFYFLNAPYNENLFDRLIPSVDKHFLQIARSDVLYQRKPEHTMEFFQICHKQYIELASGNNMIVLDSTFADEEQVLKYLLNQI